MAEGQLGMMLNAPAVRGGPCTDLETLANQVFSVLAAMGFPGPLAGPGDDQVHFVFQNADGDIVDDAGDPIVIEGSGTQSTFKNMTDGTNTATASAVDDTFTFEGMSGILCEVDDTLKKVVISFTGGGGSELTEGDGIVISAGEISVANGLYLGFDVDGKLEVTLADVSGLESDDSDPVKLRSKSRFALIRGQATTNVHGSGTVTIDNVDNLIGEPPAGISAPSDTMTVDLDDSYSVWIDNNDYVYGIAGNQDGSEFRHLGSVGHRQALKGNKNFSDSVVQILGHNYTGDSNGTVSWREITDWLKTITDYAGSGNLVLMARGGTISWRTMQQLGEDFLGYASGSNQSLGHNSGSAIQWQDDTDCS